MLSTHHVQTQEKGPPCSLRSSRPSYEVDFPTCNVHNIPPQPPTYLLMIQAPLPPRTHTYWQAPLAATCVSASASPVQPTATQQYLPEILSLWQRRTCGVLIYLCVGLLHCRDEAAVKRKGREEEDRGGGGGGEGARG